MAQNCQMKSKTEPVEIKRIVRPMRGGSQARLVEGQDGKFYVAKFAGNPQGNRTLINEWMAQSILAALGISTPSLRILHLPAAMRHEAVYFEIGNKRMPVEGEWHLGSLSPVNPETKVIFDFLPRKLLGNVVNLDEFGKVFVADRWLCQTDVRQAIFVRERGSVGRPIQLCAYFIDHGKAFAGSSWELREATGHGLYIDQSVYSLVDMREVCEATMSQIETFTEEQVFSIIATLPDCWLSAGDLESLNGLLKTLCRNRTRLRRMIENQLASSHLKDRPGTDQTVGWEIHMDRKGMDVVERFATATHVAQQNTQLLRA
jgi:hypothetical protein